MSDFGFPVDSFDLKQFIKDCLGVKTKTVRQFQSNLPGSDWMNSFLKSHKGLTVQFATNIKKV
jgi:hypothetical protein